MFDLNSVFKIFLVFLLLNTLSTVSGQQLSEYADKPCKFYNDNFIGTYKPITFNCTTLPPNKYPNNITETINDVNTTYFCCPEIRISEQVCDANSIYSEIEEHSVGSTIPVDGEVPYIAALFCQKIAREGDVPFAIEFICGGSIISEWFILTAAHCFGELDETNYFITFGKTYIGNLNDTDYIKIQDIHIHENYTTLKYNDIALVKPEKKINFSPFINSPICLHSYKMNYGIFDNELIKISGWGKFNQKSAAKSLILRKVELEYVNQTYCQSRQQYDIIHSQFCAFDAESNVNSNNRSDACKGDSGGPARIVFNEQSVLVGIVSYGNGCGSSVPGVYTRVLLFIDWIESIVWLS